MRQPQHAFQQRVVGGADPGGGLDATAGRDGANDTAASTDLDKTLPAEDYFDLAANWAITEKAGVTLGINNVLDKDPDISSAVGTTGNGNTFPQTYDALGRWIFIRAQVGF